MAQSKIARSILSRPLLLIALVIVGGFLLLIAAAALWVVTVSGRQPTISVDYVARLNQQALAVPEDQRAWPLIQKADSLIVQPTEGEFWDALSKAQPGNAEWPTLVEYVGTNAEPIRIAREAARMPGLGYPIFSPPSNDLSSGLLVNAMLPQLGSMRSVARILRDDARVAIDAGDPDRFVADIASIMALARMSHEHDVLICHLVGIAIANVGVGTVTKAIHQHPDALDKTHLEQLDALFAERAARSPWMSLEGERYFMLDVVQRCYTDDGDGDGRFAPRGWVEVGSKFASNSVGNAPAVGIVPASFMALAAAPRSEILDIHDRAFRVIEDRLASDPWTWQGPVRYDEDINTIVWGDSLSADPGHALLNTMLPAFDRLPRTTAEVAGSVAGIRTLLAAAQRRAQTGSWPDALPADIIAALPDPYTGKPLTYKIQADAPVIYSVGPDRDDDAGKWVPNADRWLPAGDPEVPDGDWVLFPPRDD